MPTYEQPSLDTGPQFPPPGVDKKTKAFIAALLCVIVGCYGFVIHGFATDHSPPDQPAVQAEQVPDPAADFQPSAQAAPAAAAPSGPSVWVNTRTGVYHLPGSRWYGATSQGQYMSKSMADTAGYRAAANGQ